MALPAGPTGARIQLSVRIRDFQAISPPARSLQINCEFENHKTENICVLSRLAFTEIFYFLGRAKSLEQDFDSEAGLVKGRGAVFAFLPLWRAEQLDSMRGSRRALFESRSEARCVRLARSSCAVASSSQAAQGYPANAGRDTGGGLLLVTFLGRARKVTSRRAAPGH
jgi:hypothetical protein